MTLQDNYFNQGKAHILIDAISRSRIQNVTIMNIAPGFDTIDHNYSDFQIYMRPILQFVKFSEISWGRKFVRWTKKIRIYQKKINDNLNSIIFEINFLFDKDFVFIF